MRALQEIKDHLTPGAVYRRADLSQWSNAVDRHLEQLQKDRTIKKLSGGLYYCPKVTTFGETPPAEHALVEAFLKDPRFLIFTQNAYNALGVGTTQLYNETLVYNHKRHGFFQLGNRQYHFVRKHHFPVKLTEEFLLVDLVDHVEKLSENAELVLDRVRLKAKQMDLDRLRKHVSEYGNLRARKFFTHILNQEPGHHGH
jgi:hypothetical protein